MINPDTISRVVNPVEVELKDATTATVMAWLWPGAGHVYQGRYAKAIVFMVCILSIYFFGLTIGGGHVVYASWAKNDKRLPYLCQIGVGIPALPALVQTYRVRTGKNAFLNGWMAPPEDVNPLERDELARWHEEHTFGFDMGTVFTMVAGLLNVLAIYDARYGPVFVIPEENADKPSSDEDEIAESE